jgi:hypothetical protein
MQLSQPQTPVQARDRIAVAIALVDVGVQTVVLLALDDRGAPVYNHAVAARLAGSGIPAFACTLDLFPELVAAAIQRRDLDAWAAARKISLVR